MTDEPPRVSTGAALIDAVADWLMTQALGDAEIEVIFEGCSDRLLAAGIPLWRTHIGYRTLHPLYDAVGLTWRRKKGMETAVILHSEAAAAAWRESPYFRMTETGIPFLRRRLAGDQALLDFSILTEFRDGGATDYLAFLVAFGESKKDGLVGSWTTDRAGGFSDQDIRSLVRIQRRLAVAAKVTIKDQIARNVVTAYLGPDAGRRVLNGQIKRGDGETIHSVIWLSDMRGATHLADTMDPNEFIGVLNSYFECTAGAVLAHGGEVLSFIGDAVLAIFPTGDEAATESAACEKALAAVRDADERMARVNDDRAASGLAALSFGIGLHVGDVMYGNVGVPERLQFTVIGPAANEVARIESLTKELDHRVLVSSQFARNLSDGWNSLGEHVVKGVAKPLEVFYGPDT